MSLGDLVNILLDAIRTRCGLNWRIPAMPLAIPYLLVAAFCVQLIEDGGPGGLHLLVSLVLWNMLKMLWIGPVSLVPLIRARLYDAVAGRRARRAPDAGNGDAAQGVLVGSAIGDGDARGGLHRQGQLRRPRAKAGNLPGRCTGWRDARSGLSP